MAIPRISVLPFCVALAALVCESTRGADVDGDKPYTMTRMEFLTVYFNSTDTKDELVPNGFSIYVIPHPEKDVLFIYVTVDPVRLNRDAMKNHVAALRGTIERYAKRRGWDSWLIIKEHYSNVNKPSPPF